MSGWELTPFNQYFYPPKPRKGFRKLEYYSQFFDCVEVNATFYNTAFTQEHVRRWLLDVSANKNFVFTVKLFQGFTHTFTASKEDLLSVHRMLAPLVAEEKLGGLVMQFPYSFSYIPQRLTYLHQLSKAFQQYRLFVELRHNTWNSPGIFNSLQEHKLHLINVDLPRIKEHIPFLSTAWEGAAYFRMMGRNAKTWNNPRRLEKNGKHIINDRYNYLYRERELERLLAQIENIRNFADSVYVVFHNDPEANSLVNGFQLRHRIRHNQRVLVPENFVKTYPMLKPISSQVNIHHPFFAEA